MNFEINLIFLIKLFFLHEQIVMTKTQISWERKELLRWNKKQFFIIFKGLFMKQITQFFFGRWESDFNIRTFFWHRKLSKLSEINVAKY